MDKLESSICHRKNAGELAFEAVVFSSPRRGPFEIDTLLCVTRAGQLSTFKRSMRIVHFGINGHVCYRTCTFPHHDISVVLDMRVSGVPCFSFSTLANVSKMAEWATFSV